MNWNPPQSWYEPPEPPGPCCTLGEDDPDHDVEACLADSAEAAAEARAEARAEREAEDRWER